MSTKEHWLDYRGELHGLSVDGTHLAFVTRHDEEIDTGVFRLDPLSGELLRQVTPGGVDLDVVAGERWVVAGRNGHVWQGRFGSLAPVGPRFDPAPYRVAGLQDGRLGVLAGQELTVLEADGRLHASFDLGAEGTALAADPSRQWLVVGTNEGRVAVFSVAEGAWHAHQAAQLHEGGVKALRFERDELRFRSSGADNRFLITHARGALESIDRGGRHGHSKPILGMAGDGELVYTAAEDGQIKAWRRGQRRQPASQSQGVGKATGLVEVVVDGTPHLAVAGTDHTIRLFPRDEDGRVLARTVRFHGALASAQHELDQDDPERRSAVLVVLAGYDDTESLEMLSSTALNDPDREVQVQAAEAIAASDHPRVPPLLEPLLTSEMAGVRAAALAGLRRRFGAAELRPLQLGLQSRYADLGQRVVSALAQLAQADERASSMLVGALSHAEGSVREAALTALEALHPDDAAASLFALRSSVPDMRWRAVLRIYQRGLAAEAERELRAATEDADANVRQVAYLVRLLRYPVLSAHLRALDDDLHRHLHALEHHGSQESATPPPAVLPSEPPPTLTPLLQAAASRMRDTALRGARHLALLGDDRALGILLQLSREGDPELVVRVCRALLGLGDPRAEARMRAMLGAGEPKVRDAAFSVLERLLADEPSVAAATGLVAGHPDVRTRGLRVLVRQLEQSGVDAQDAPLELLALALNDVDKKLRTDAFKATLRLEVGGSHEGALRFALQSAHADVRREVLTEVMSEVRHDWAWRLLLERYDDPDGELRRESFAFARKQGRTRTPDPVVAALGCRYADLRRLAVEVLGAKVDERAQPWLVQALDDDEPEVRGLAFVALQNAGDLDALLPALDSRHVDVRVRAAATLAQAGRDEAVEVLREQITVPRPKVSELAKEWRQLLGLALQGIAWLRHAPATADVLDWMDDEDAVVRRSAAETLVWIAPRAELRRLLQHEDHAVRAVVATGLAWRGDASGATLISDGVSFTNRVGALVVLGDADQLVALLDEGNEANQKLLLRVLLLLDWTHAGAPDRLIACLTAADPRVRLTVADVLQHWAQPEALGDVIATRVNEQGDDPAWSVPSSVLRQIGLALSSGEGLDRAAAVGVLGHFGAARQKASHEADEASRNLLRAWELVNARSRGRIATITDLGPPEALALHDVVFGTYVGLSSQVAGQDGAAVRATAVRRISGLEGVDSPARVDALIPALADSHGTVRLAAFEALRSLGVPAVDLAAEALATGHRDLGQEGLTLLADGGDEPALWRVLATRDDGLQLVAFDVLEQRAGPQAVAEAALAARSEDVRALGVASLQGRYADDPEAVQALRAAVNARHLDVRLKAAQALAQLGDDAALPALRGFLRDDAWQPTAIRSLAAIGGPAAADAMLERLEADPGRTARFALLFSAIAELRLPETAGRLFGLLERNAQLADNVLQALTTVSGYDQPLYFVPEHPEADERWLDFQHPRHDDIFARVLQERATRRHLRELHGLLLGATWAKGSAVDEPLIRMLRFPDEGLRHAAAAAYAWRVRYRRAVATPLEQALSHADPVTSFLAAEGLALSGATAGLGVLLASVDGLESVQLRSRAVLALGHTGDERALDKLLDIVQQDDHALVEPAAEAIGHLGHTSARDKILRRLLQLSRRTDNIGRRALVGLRWFGSPQAWARLREAAKDEDARVRVSVATLLRHDDSATQTESREELERLVTEDPNRLVADRAVQSLRHLWGPDSLEPDYVALLAYELRLAPDALARLRERGDAGRILDALADPRFRQPTLLDPLLMALVSRDPLPIEEAMARVDAAKPDLGALAARVIGRAIALAEAHRTALARAAVRALDHWEEQLRHRKPLDASTERVRWILWAAARHGVAVDQFARALQLTGPEAAPVVAAAAHAMSVRDGGEEALGRLAQGGSARSRALAAGTLVARDPEHAGDIAAKLLDDAVAAHPLLMAGARPANLTAAAEDASRMGIALRYLVVDGRLDALSAALQNPDDAVRRGALEGLGAIGTEDAERVLQAFGADPARDEEERKVAWRALRRSRRRQAGRAQS